MPLKDSNRVVKDSNPSPATTLTIRLDPQVKAAAELTATGQGISLTEFVVRALRAETNPTCPTCGRSAPSASLSAAFTPSFKAFYDDLGSMPFVLFTSEEGQRVVYWATLPETYPLKPNVGSVSFLAPLFIDRRTGWRLPSDEKYPTTLPLGVITGWSRDQEGKIYERQLTLGYLDGNEPGRRAHRAARLGV